MKKDNDNFVEEGETSSEISSEESETAKTEGIKVNELLEYSPLKSNKMERMFT